MYVILFVMLLPPFLIIVINRLFPVYMTAHHMSILSHL